MLFTDLLSDCKQPPNFDWWTKLNIKRNKNDNKDTKEYDNITNNVISNSEEKSLDNKVTKQNLINFQNYTTHPTPLTLELTRKKELLKNLEFHEKVNLIRSAESKLAYFENSKSKKLIDFSLNQNSRKNVWTVVLKTKKIYSFIKNGVHFKKYGIAVYECDKKSVKFFKKREKLVWSGEIECGVLGFWILNNGLEKFGIFKSVVEYEIFKDKGFKTDS